MQRKNKYTFYLDDEVCKAVEALPKQTRSVRVNEILRAVLLQATDTVEGRLRALELRVAELEERGHVPSSCTRGPWHASIQLVGDTEYEELEHYYGATREALDDMVERAKQVAEDHQDPILLEIWQGDVKPEKWSGWRSDEGWQEFEIS